MTNYKFKRERLSKVLEKDSLANLVAQNWYEAEDFRDEIELDVDWEKYITLEDLGMLGFYTVRNNKDKLVGYAAVFADNNLHHKQDIFAKIETFFVHPKHRSHGTALKFFQYVIDDIKRHDVSLITFSVKYKHLIEKVLPRYDFKPIETLFALLVKDDT